MRLHNRQNYDVVSLQLEDVIKTHLLTTIGYRLVQGKLQAGNDHLINVAIIIFHVSNYLCILC